MALKTAPRTRTLVRNDEVMAAAEIDLRSRTDQNYTRATVAHSKSTSARPWNWYDNIGEVHYAISRSARIAGYAKLQCVRYDEKGEVEAIVTDGPAAEYVRNITSPYGGTRGLIDRFYTLMKIGGDSYLIDVKDADGDSEGYHFMSPDEMDLSSFSRWRPGAGALRWITVPQSNEGGNGATSRFTREVQAEDMLGRVWQSNRRYADLTDSALRALDVECEALDLLTKTIKAKLMSRFALAGLFFIPDSIANARTTRTQNQIAGQEVDNTINYLIAAMTKNVRNWEDATAYMPILLKGPADAGEKIKHITMDREIFETDLNLRRELINRILQGLDSNQDTTKGGEAQSHWGVWAASDEERRIAVQPDLEVMTWAMTRLILHRKLQEDGMAPEEILKHGVGFDLSAAAVKSNQQEDARQLADRGLINDDAVLRMNGLTEKDKMDEEGYVRWVGQQTKNPVLMMHGLPEEKKIDWDKAMPQPVVPGPAPDSTADDPERGPGQGDPGSPDDRETDTPRTQRPA
jgi:hypothetical protein